MKRLLRIAIQRKSIKSIIAFSCYSALIAVGAFTLPKQWMQWTFLLYALFLFWIVWRYALRADETSFIILPSHFHRFFVFLFFFALAMLVMSRLLPFARYGATPLGYDTGFYLQSVEEAIRSIGDASAGITGHRAFRAFLWIPLSWLGLSPVALLHGLYVLFQFCIAGALYTLARTLAVTNRFAYASILLFLFTVSVPQFYAFWWMFYQTELSLAFLLLTIAFLHRRSVLAFFTAGFGAAVHPATFFGFGIAALLFTAIALCVALARRRFPSREVFFLLAICVSAFLAFRYLGREFVLVYLRGPIQSYGWFLTEFPYYLRQQFTGLYITPQLFSFTMIYLLPFAVLGVLLFLFRKIPRVREGRMLRFSFLFIFLLVLSVLAYFPFLYQHRHLIYLDLVLILFAVYPFFLFLHALSSHWLHRMTVILLLFGFVSYNAYAVWAQEPQVYRAELEEIQSIAVLSDANAYAMTTESVYTPWVSYFSRRATIDPGYLPYNLWTHAMWREFWFEKSDARRHELLRMYDRPMYIFVGRRIADAMPYKQFMLRDTHFVRLGRYLWKYDPRQVSAADIALWKEEEKAKTPQ